MEVEIELGHKAWKNIKPTIEGNTYDWTLFVQGVNGNEIKHIVEKVIFYLPDSYSYHTQMKGEPPFVLSESTSQSFSMEIDIFFCAGSNLDKVSYIYDLSIGEEEVDELWQKNIKFINPSEDFKEKLLLAGGRVIDAQKTSEINAALIECKVEPDDEIKIIKEIEVVKALNSTPEKIDDLSESKTDDHLLRFNELFKENEDLKTASEKVKEKTEFQETLIDFYKKKLPAWETDILNSSMVINQLKKKVTAYEGEISALKLQMQMLQNLFSQMQNGPTKSPEAKKRGRKRKNKENLNESVPVEKKRGNIIQPQKVISSPTRNDSCTSKSPLTLKDPSVSMQNKNICETVATKCSPSFIRNSPLSKKDTALNLPSDNSSENSSQSNIEILFANDNSSLHQNVHTERTLGTSSCRRKVPSDTDSFESANSYDEELMEGISFQINASLNKSGTINNNSMKPAGGNSVVADAALNECEIKNIVCKKSENGSSTEVSSSRCIPERRNSHAIPTEVNPVSDSLNKPEIRSSHIKKPVKINCSEKLLRGSPGKAGTALNKPTTRSMKKTKRNHVIPIEVNPIAVNASLNKCDIRNSDIEPAKISSDVKMLTGSSAKANVALNKSKRGNNGVEKHMEKNSFQVKTSLNKPKNCDIEKPVQINSGVKLLKGSSTEGDAALDKSTIGKCNGEKPMEINPITVNASLNKRKIRSSDIEVPVKINSCKKLPRRCAGKADAALSKSKILNVDVEKPVEKNSVSLNKPKNCDIEELVKINSGEKGQRASSAEADVALNKSETGNGNVEKPMKRNSVEINASLDKPEIRKDGIEEPVRINDGGKSQKESTTDVSQNKSKVRNRDEEKLVEGTSAEVTTPLNKLEKKINVVKPVLGDSTKTDISMSNLCTKPHNKNLEEPIDTPAKERNESSIEKTDMKSLNSNCKETGKKHFNIGVKISSVTSSNTKYPPKRKNRKPKNGHLENRSLPSEIFSFNTIWKEPPRDINDTSASSLMEFMPVHYPKLAAELDRIHNSKFSMFRHTENPLFYELGQMNSDITEKYFMRHVHTLTDFLTNPKTSYDVATIVYLVVNYLASCTIDDKKLPSYIRNQENFTILPNSENCIVSALYEIEKKSIPHLYGLLRNIVNTIQRAIISKKGMAVRGLASLCRIFMELCRLCDDRWMPLFLCCEVLKSEHPLAPYLINSLAGIWRSPFYLHNQYSVEEKILLGSIMYGMNVKPVLMDSDLWRLTCRLTSTNFPFPIVVEPREALQFLTRKIISRCNEGLFQDLWMLTSPLMNFVSYETLKWKIQFGKEYIIPNILYFAKCFNEPAFNLFSNLYLDICKCCNENPTEDLLKFFTNAKLCEGASLVRDCAAIALLKYIGTTDKPVPTSLRNWMLRNINNPKLGVIADLYCKRVMESNDYSLLWDDVIIL